MGVLETHILKSCLEGVYLQEIYFQGIDVEDSNYIS